MSAQLSVNANTWKSYYQNLVTNDDANRNLGAFKTCTNHTNTDFEKNLFLALSEDPDTVIMAVAPITGKMKLYHSVSNLGGTRRRKENLLVGMEGFGPSATPIKFDMGMIKTIVDMKVPRKEDLLTSTDAAAAEQLDEDEFSPFKHAILVILPPMLVVPYLELDTRDPAELLIETVSIITAFDETHKDDDDFPDAKEECIYVLNFLWAVAKGRIPKLLCLANSDDAELTQWGSMRHSSSVLPGHANAFLTPPGLPPMPVGRTNADSLNAASDSALHELSGNIKNQTNVLEKMRQDKAEENKEKNHKFDSLHESTKRLILNASSMDGESIPSLPEETCKLFYAKTTVGKAMDYMAMTLREKFSCVVEISTGLVSALYTGKFIREREDSPSNFSFFMVPKLKPLSSGFAEQAMILQLKATQGKGWSDSDLKEAVKQGIVTPTSPNELQYQLQNLWGLAAFFFGSKSILPAKLGNFISQMENHALIIEAKHLRDPEFCTKLGYAVDNRIFRWLENCSLYEEREAVNDDMINFSPIMEEILFDKFHQMLPSTFSTFQKRKKDDEKAGDESSPAKKKQKKNDQVQQKLANPSPIQEWLCTDGAQYSAKFAGRNTEKRPKLDGVPMCQRWHTKGYCFNNCKHIATHVPSTELDQSAKEKYKEYVSMCTA